MGDFMLKVAQWISENKYIQSLIGGLMAIMPITLGVAAVAVLINLPMDGWQYFLTETTDIRFHAQEMLEATQTITALYISFTIAYTFTKNEGENGVTGGIMALASFLILMPQTIPVLVDGEVVGAAAGLARNLLGSQGI
ncbi:MAG: PTS sugar transporter subunit IIC, partial [Turicibacter sp.]|nr:PTS sugar transporter subunit IIC [Turicibacter sp.]